MIYNNIQQKPCQKIPAFLLPAELLKVNQFADSRNEEMPIFIFLLDNFT